MRQTAAVHQTAKRRKMDFGREDGAEVWEANGQLYLQVDGETVALRHEEHKPVHIPKGTWRIGIVQEYDPFEQEARRVAD